MGMYVYKMFNPGLVCRDYQFKEGVNECEHATCARNGFHAAENPLDCLSYYSDFEKSECWLCYADGEVHEDGSDSKISCTRLEILRRLGKVEYLAEALRYMIRHPKRPWSSHVEINHGSVHSNGMVIVRGQEPLARGTRVGDLLALAKEAPGTGEVIEVGLYRIDGEELKPGVYYDIRGNERERREAIVCD